MNVLLPELTYKICSDIVRITDLRNLARVSTEFNKICTKCIPKLEDSYKQKYPNLIFTKYLDKITIEKYTIEIILDEYYDQLPEKYYNKDNTIICVMLSFKERFDLLKYAQSKSCPITNDIIKCAAYVGRIDMIQWAIENIPNIEISKEYANICINLSYNGHIDVLDWMRNNNYDIIIPDICSYAGRKGQLHVYQWLKTHNYELNYGIVDSAAANGHIHVLEWAHENNYIKNNNFCVTAAIYGQTKILQWALDHKYTIENINCKDVIECGHIHVLQWLIAHDYNFNKSLLCEYAATSGKINVLQWLIDNNYKLHPSFYAAAIIKNHLGVLKWAYYNGYLMNNLDLKLTIEKGKIQVLSWLIKNDLLTNPVTIDYDEDDILVLKYGEIKRCFDLYDVELDTIHLLIKKYFTTKKQYNFVINDGKIIMKKYGNHEISNKQQIVCVEKYSYFSSEFRCEHNCWWYFLLYCKNGRSNIKNFSRDKINECCQHKKYMNYIKN